MSGEAVELVIVGPMCFIDNDDDVPAIAQFRVVEPVGAFAVSATELLQPLK